MTYQLSQRLYWAGIARASQEELRALPTKCVILIWDGEEPDISWLGADFAVALPMGNEAMVDEGFRRLLWEYLVLLDHAPTLVLCNGGQNRSPTLAAALHCLWYLVPFQHAWEMVLCKRPDAARSQAGIRGYSRFYLSLRALVDPPQCFRCAHWDRSSPSTPDMDDGWCPKLKQFWPPWFHCRLHAATRGPQPW